MAAIVWTDVTALAPELATMTDATAQAAILAYVNGPGVDPSGFDVEAGPTTRLARIYLAAHMASGIGTGPSGAAGGPVTSESVGGLSRSYGSASIASSADAMGSTAYGRLFEALVKNSLHRLPFVI